KFTVLDDTDAMINMCSIYDQKDISKAIQEQHQTLLFSATMPKEIREIATTLMKQPTEIKVKAKEMTVENINQYFMEVPERSKFDTLTNHHDNHSTTLTIVFTSTKRRI